MATTSLPHARQDRSNDIGCPKEIDFKLFPEIPVTDLFKCTHESYISHTKQTLYILFEAVLMTTSIRPNFTSASATED